MKLNENTLTILKNFSSINSGVVLQKGKIQKSISPEQSILVEAVLEDDFPEQFGIYDLNQFLGNVTFFNSPDLAFKDNKVVIQEGEFVLNYGGCSPSLIISPPQDKTLTLKSVDISFNLTNVVLAKLLRLSSMNSLTHISVMGKNGELRLKAHEKANDTSNDASIKIGDHDGKDFIVSFKTENLRLIPDDYAVEIAIGSFSKWKNKSGNLTYFIALETK